MLGFVWIMDLNSTVFPGARKEEVINRTISQPFGLFFWLKLEVELQLILSLIFEEYVAFKILGFLAIKKKVLKQPVIYFTVKIQFIATL